MMRLISQSLEQSIWKTLEDSVDMESLLLYLLSMTETAGLEILFYLKVAFIIALGIALIAVALWTLVGS